MKMINHCPICAAQVIWDGAECNVRYLDARGRVRHRPGPDATPQERHEFAVQACHEYCPNLHPLPSMPVVSMGVFGFTRSGKGALVRALARQVIKQPLADGFSIEPAGRSKPLLRRRYGDDLQQTPLPPEGDHPASLFFDVWREERRLGEFLVYDTAGEAQQVLFTEDADSATSQYRQRYPFVPFLDAIIIAVAPGCLTGFEEYDAHIDQEKFGGANQLSETLDIVDTIRDFYEEFPYVEFKDRTIFVVLTKCDRYEREPSFPPELLLSRAERQYSPVARAAKGRGLDASAVRIDEWIGQIEEEGQVVRQFVLSHGGQALVNRVESLGETYYVALSGAGNDTDTSAERPQSKLHPPARVGAPDRALDPFVALLFQEGLDEPADRPDQDASRG